MAWTFYNSFGAVKVNEEGAFTSLDWKKSVRYTTTGDINLLGIGAQANLTGSVAAGDRILVKDQTAGFENGIYVADPSSWTRATDADSDVDVTPGMAVYVEEGSTLSDTLWFLTTDATITLDATALVFSDINPANFLPLAGGTMTGQTILSDTNIQAEHTAANNGVYRSKVSGDAQLRWLQYATGQAFWGSGALVADVALSRNGVGMLALTKQGAATRAALQVADLPIAADDLTNQVYVDRMDMFFA